MEKVWITFDGQEIEVEVEKMAEYKRIEDSIKSKRVVEWRRVNRAKKAADSDVLPYHDFVVADPDPFDVLMKRELKARINAAVDKLPPRQKEAFVLVHYEGRTMTEAAKKMEITRQAVRESLDGALKNLKKLLEVDNPYKT